MQHLLTIIFFDPFLNALLLLYKIIFSNLGLAIIALTIVVRIAILPFNLKSLISQRRIQHLKPHLDALKVKHAEDKTALAQAQMGLYKEHGVNPVGGFGWLLLQAPFLFGMFTVLKFVVGLPNVQELNKHLYTSWLYLQHLSDLHLIFGWVNLGKPDPLYILPVLAGLTQFGLSWLSLPKHVSNPKPAAEQTFEDTLASTSRQMLYLLPVMTVIFTLRFPSGLALYWTVGNLFSIIQQFYVNWRHPALLPSVVPTVLADDVPQTILQAPTSASHEKKAHKKKRK
jgi:YidC/Oxa1 family membrane protein insertase